MSITMPGFKKSLNYVYVNMYMCAYVWVCVHESKYSESPAALDTLELELQVFLSHPIWEHGCWAVNLDPLQEQCPFLTAELLTSPWLCI